MNLSPDSLFFFISVLLSLLFLPFPIKKLHGSKLRLTNHLERQERSHNGIHMPSFTLKCLLLISRDDVYRAVLTDHSLQMSSRAPFPQKKKQEAQLSSTRN
ncbi:hypothetical protein Dimus_001336 [Dionaea muscipula]